MLWAIAFATPFFLFWGWLSDKVGRKWIMMAGMLIGILTYRPIFQTFLDDTEVPFALNEKNPQPGVVSVHVNDKNDSIVTTTTPHYYIKGINFYTQKTDTVFSGESRPIGHSQEKVINKKLGQSLYWKFIALVFLLILYVTMVYGPIAAFLVEMFPTKIRYTSMSLPYHIGNGVFGGLVPFIGLLLTTTYPKDPLVGLWYPIGVAALCFIIGTIYLTNKIDKEVND
jgi:MFS family permease